MINSAVVDAAHYMEKHAGPGGRRAILILTDNLSTSYQLTDGQVIRELNKADTVFNAIITGRAIRPEPPSRASRQSRLHAGQCLRTGREDRRRMGEGGERGRFVQGNDRADSQPLYAGLSRASVARALPAYR